MRYFDCFPFFNEIQLLKIRLEVMRELDPIFVLVESTYTHVGDPKPLYFDDMKDLFSDYKIRHVIVEDMPNNGNAWDNENFQRDCIARGLHDLQPDDIVIVSDLDEIPNPIAVRKFKPEMVVGGLKMDKYTYFLNCLECVQCWESARITTGEHLMTTTPNKLRDDAFRYVFEHAGWHFSFQGGIEKMMEKIYAYAHTENVNSKFSDPDILIEKMKTGQSMWTDKEDDKWAFVPIDTAFPLYLQENLEQYKNMIHEIPK